MADRRYVHGMAGTKLYFLWRNMLSRCYNSNDSHYQWWGGRGITVCDEWQTFPPFYAWVLTIYPDGQIPKGLTLDRKENEGHYSPDNCRWITHKEQCNNRRSNRWLTHNGKTQNVVQWAKELNVPAPTLYDRLRKGWPAHKILVS